ncbi:MAG: tetratricopeptide repeat protein [Janthinobacterium lividum]
MKRGRLGAWWVAAALMAPVAATAATDTPGWLAFDAGRPVDAVREWRSEAAAGDKDASFGLGVAYDLGKGVGQDDRMACRFYAEAAEHGHVLAAFNVAVMHDSGRCAQGRHAELAALWYGRAAAAGNGRAQFNLAMLYAAGDGVPRNPAASAAWYQAAASNGISAAANRGREERRSDDGQQPVLATSPAYPGPTQTVPRGDPVTLVWSAPEQPSPVRFFLEVYALKPAGAVEVAGRYVDLTAIRLPLPPDATRFTWRVLTVGTRPLRYAVGPWSDFTISPAGPRS